ncbi:MAG: hypothetical protein ACN6PY_11530, partial [Paraburkholderia nemoris]
TATPIDRVFSGSRRRFFRVPDQKNFLFVDALNFRRRLEIGFDGVSCTRMIYFAAIVASKRLCKSG